MLVLKVKLLSAKNVLRQSLYSPKKFLQHLSLCLLPPLVCVGLYSSSLSLFEELKRHPQLCNIFMPRLMGIALFAFFALLLFSNCVAALGFFYGARDLSLLLSLPIPKLKLYCWRMVQVVVNSSWIFALFIVPCALAMHSCFESDWTFLPFTLVICLLFAAVPALLASIFSTILVNLCPLQKLREVLLITGLALLSVFFLFGSSRELLTEPMGEGYKNDLVQMLLHEVDDPQPKWLPSKWAAIAISQSLGFSESRYRYSLGDMCIPVILLASLCVGLFCGGFLLFDLLSARGWDIANAANKSFKVRASGLENTLERILVPFSPQFRALLFKELRMFTRDSTQSLQLLMLLMLAFVYLYHFRTLQSISTLSEEGQMWWKVILSFANILFGACVVSAIATRFAFPSVSLEGRAYSIIRFAPLSLRSFLNKKLAIWFLPICAMSSLLFASGAMAFQASPTNVISTVVIAIALSVGIAGLAIGIGAVYARFDWDTPSQVAASFGSLVFMFFAVVLVSLSLIPATLLFVISSVPNYTELLSPTSYYLLLFGSNFLLFLINFSAANTALAAGEQRLLELEK